MFQSTSKKSDLNLKNSATTFFQIKSEWSVPSGHVTERFNRGLTYFIILASYFITSYLRKAEVYKSIGQTFQLLLLREVSSKEVVFESSLILEGFSRITVLQPGFDISLLFYYVCASVNV